MNKKTLGAILGVIGTAGGLTGTQFLHTDRTRAGEMAKNLIDEYQGNATSAEKKTTTTVEPVKEEKVFNASLKVEYVMEAGSLAKNVDVKENPAAADKAQAQQQALEEKKLKVETKLQEKTLQIAKQASEEKVETSVSSQKPEEEQPAQTSESAPRAAESVSEEKVPEEKEEKDEKEEKEESKPAETPKEESLVAVVTAKSLFIRAAAGTEGEILGSFRKGDVVRGVKSGDWVRLDTPNAQFVSADFVQAVDPSTVEGKKTGDTTLNEEQLKARAAEDEKAAEEKAAREKAEAEKKASEKKAKADKKAAEEKAAAEKKEAEEKAAAEKKTAQAKAPVQTLYVTVGLHLRAEPNTNSAIIRTFSVGTKLEGTLENGWLKLSDGTGYVCAEYLTKEPLQGDSSQKTPDTKTKEKTMYVTTGLNLRKGPSTDTERVRTLAIGTKVIGTEVGEWFKLSDGSGYVKTKFLSSKAPRPKEETTQKSEKNKEYAGSTVEKIIAEAKDLQGTPYVYGGASPRQGFDCSGLTMYLYKKYAGISMWHSAEWQGHFGTGVAFKDMQPGDLIIFDTVDYMAHVGIYIGNGEFIHASSSKRQVTTSSIVSGYYRRAFNTARRIIH